MRGYTLRDKYGIDGRALRQQLGVLDQRIARYIDAIGAGVDIKVCQAEIEKARARKLTLESQAEVIQQEDYCNQALEKNRTQVARFAETLKGDFTRLPMPVQRRIVLYFVRDLLVKDRKELVIETIVPFDNVGLDQLLDEIETAENTEQETSAPADQDLSFSGRSGHGRGDLKWLQSLAPTGNQYTNLESWSASTSLPPHPGFGIQREHPPEEVMVRPATFDADLDEESSVEGASISGALDPWAPRLQAIRDRLAQARGWKLWLAEADDRRPVDVARRAGVSRARVCQVMRLLDLTADIQWDLERPDHAGAVPSEKQLRDIAMLADPFEQMARYRALVMPTPRASIEVADEPLAPPEAALPEIPVASPVHVRGFKHLFERARHFQSLIDGEQARSVADLARQERVSPSRVNQIMHLLHLAPQIVAILDVPESLCPPVTHKEILGVARLKNKSHQLRAFWGLVSAPEKHG